MPGKADDIVTLGSGKQSIGKTHNVGTRTIQVNNIVDFQRVFDGADIKKFAKSRATYRQPSDMTDVMLVGDG